MPEVAGIALLLRAALVAAGGGGLHSRPSIPPFVCTVSRPAAPAGSVVDAAVLLPAGEEAGLRFSWTPEMGAVSGSGARVRWTLPRGFTGRTALHVTFDDASGATDACILSVAVISGGVRAAQAGRSLLLPDMREAPGFGLYSYILLPHRPDAPSAGRYRAALEAYADLIEDVEELEKFLPRAQLASTMAYVQRRPARTSGDSLLAVYHWARAAAAIRGIEAAPGDGPYLVSSLRPLVIGQPPPHGVFIQDLSAVPAALVSLWVGEFLRQSTQEPAWSLATLRRLALRTRTYVAIAGQDVQGIKEALDTWMKWKP